jgi:hypothetical protein
MTAGVATLGDDHVGTGRRRIFGLRQGLDLADNLAAGVPDAFCKGRRIAKDNITAAGFASRATSSAAPMAKKSPRPCPVELVISAGASRS